MKQITWKEHAVSALELWYGMKPLKKDMWLKDSHIKADGTCYYTIGVRHITYLITVTEFGGYHVQCLD